MGVISVSDSVGYYSCFSCLSLFHLLSFILDLIPLFSSLLHLRPFLSHFLAFFSSRISLSFLQFCIFILQLFSPSSFFLLWLIVLLVSLFPRSEKDIRFRYTGEEEKKTDR